MARERPTRPAGSAAPRRPTSGPAAGGKAATLLGLQRSAGNAAVAQRMFQGGGAGSELAEGLGFVPAGGSGTQAGGATGDGHDLASPRFKDIARLQSVFDDRDRVGPGSSGESVVAIQQALLDLNRGYDLGQSGADGIYGQKTAAAVRRFKTEENLGSTQHGDVGPGTIGRLDEIFPGGDGPDPVPPDDLNGATVVHEPPGLNAGETPDEQAGAGEDGAPRKPRAIPILARQAVQTAALSIGTETLGLQAERGDEVQRDGPVTPPNSLGDLTPTKLDADIRKKRRNALVSLWNPISNVLFKVENAVVAAAEKVAELIMGAITGVATAVLGPVGTFLSVVANWFFGGSIKAWVGKQIRRLIRPIIDPLRKQLDFLRDRFNDKIESFTDLALEPAMRFYRRLWDWTMRTFRPVIRFYVDAVEWMRITLATIGIDVSKVPILKDINKVALDLDEYGKPEKDPGASVG